MAFHLGPAGHWTRVGSLVSKKEAGGEVKSSKRTPGFVGAFDKCALFSAITQAVLDGPPECRGGQTGEVGLPIDGGARG